VRGHGGVPAGASTHYLGNANANASGTALLPAELRDDPTLYPDAATLQRLHVVKVHTDGFSRLQSCGLPA
jgi:hypothetical protein